MVPASDATTIGP